MLFAVAWPTQILLRNVQHLPTHLYRLKELQFRSSANVGKLEYYLNVIITRFTLTQSGDTWLSSSWGYQMISFQVRLSSSAMQGNESRNWSGKRWAGGKYSPLGSLCSWTWLQSIDQAVPWDSLRDADCGQLMTEQLIGHFDCNPCPGSLYISYVLLLNHVISTFEADRHTNVQFEINRQYLRILVVLHLRHLWLCLQSCVASLFIFCIFDMQRN